MTAADGRTVLRWAGATDIGKVRSINQDQYMLRPEAQLWVVADGMGGHRGGEVASHLACKEMARSYQERTIDGLVRAVSLANRTVYEAGLADPELRGMGTTMVALSVVAGEEDASGPGPGREVLAIANVGDSRAYRLTQGQLEQLTQDHSLVADMVREGSLSPDDAETHPQKNILTRVLGVNDDVPVDITTDVPRRGDRYLLCSDGLFNEVTEDEIEAVLRRVTDPDEAANELIRLALSGGARDNATVVIVDVLDDGHQSAGAAHAATAAQVPPGLGTAEMPPADAFPAPDENGDGNPPNGISAAELAAVTAEQDDSPQGDSRRSRRQQRRRDRESQVREDKPRRFTWRVGLFVILLVAVFGGAIATIQWYGQAAYFVGFEGDDVVIYRGRPGGILWMNPKLVETSALERGDLREDQEMTVESGREYSSLDEAQALVAQWEERVEQPDGQQEDRQQEDQADEQSAGSADP